MCLVVERAKQRTVLATGNSNEHDSRLILPPDLLLHLTTRPLKSGAAKAGSVRPTKSSCGAGGGASKGIGRCAARYDATATVTATASPMLPRISRRTRILRPAFYSEVYVAGVRRLATESAMLDPRTVCCSIPENCGSVKMSTNCVAAGSGGVPNATAIEPDAPENQSSHSHPSPGLLLRSIRGG